MVAPAVHVLRPAPLSACATTAVVCQRLPKAADAFNAACYRATGGNAFLLGELLGELADDGVEGTASEAEKVLESVELPESSVEAASESGMRSPHGAQPRSRAVPRRRLPRHRRVGRS